MNVRQGIYISSDFIDKKVKAKEHWQNKYGNLSTNQNQIVGSSIC